MCLTIDELSAKVMRAKEDLHTAPARSDHPGLNPGRATRFSARLAACPSGTPGSDADARGARRDRRPAGDGVAAERRFTNDPRVLNRATWSARHGSKILLGVLLTRLVPPGATIVLGADDTVERRVIHRFGLQGVAMRLLVPVPWSQRGWALPFLTALCGPATRAKRRRHKTSVDWVRQMVKPVRRWLPGHRLVLVVDGGFAAVSLALAWVTHPVVMVSRVRWDAALYPPPGCQPPGKRGRKPTKGQRQRSLQGWAERSDTPWEDVEVGWDGGQQKKRWVFSRTALSYTPRLPPVAIRYVLGADPEGQRRLEAFCYSDL